MNVIDICGQAIPGLPNITDRRARWLYWRSTKVIRRARLKAIL